MSRQKTELSADPTDFVKDPTMFYVPNSGRESVTVAGRIAPETMQRMQEIIQAGVFPYRNTSDFIRSAVHKLIDTVGPKMGKRFLQDLKISQASVRSAQRLSRIANISKMTDEHINAIEAVLRVGGSVGLEMAEEAYVEILGTIKTLEHPFREIAMKRMLEWLKHGELTKGLRARVSGKAAVDKSVDK